MTDEQIPKTIYRKGYQPPTHCIESLDLRFELDETATQVHSRLQIRAVGEARRLYLNGDPTLELLAIELDGEPLGPERYQRDEEGLTIELPECCELTITTRIDPSANSALEGLYVSGGNFCTQCEAEGFRSITYYPDRPDVLTVFTTTIVADRKYPVLLANGNCTGRGELEDGRHFATWHDPFPKPAYLFALVAGDLACVRDRFTTHSGREVALELYVQHGNEDKCEHAMRSLKKAMAWDEEAYGREYDLDIYMIVAVDDFNMGAMENKGLNVFNSKFVLARPESATDTDFVNIEAVIGHEYFHNWSGNRVTCRDWFQLSLKEGFTVFRDQQFTADMTSMAVKRIDDVRMLRSRQFPEDAGPMAHPVRPDSYVEINNFYTLTVYEKGAEVVRMLHTLLGTEGFRRGADLYFERHDGQAVTCDDFVQAMADANGAELEQFRRWYAVAGTPRISVERHYDEQQHRYVLKLRQHTPPTPGQAEKPPLHIPLKLALLDGDGRELPLRLEDEPAAPGTERVLDLTEAEQTLIFEDIPAEPVPSLLRDFSAPVILELEQTNEELAFLMGHDSDAFNRWEAGQRLGLRVMQRLLAELREGKALHLHQGLSEAFARTLGDENLDPVLAAEALELPDEAYVAEFEAPADPEAIHRVRLFLRRELAGAHRQALQARYEALEEHGPYAIDAAAMGRRRLRNTCLSYLALLDGGDAMAHRQYAGSHNMTDTLAALRALLENGHPQAEQALEAFYDSWSHDPLVLDKWFAIQAATPRPDALARVEALYRHPDFHIRNPNRARALIGSFAMNNPARFHAADGGGYRFLAERVLELDAINPQVAARMVTPLIQWRRYTPERQQAMREELERLLAANPSRDVYELVSKGLA